MPQYEIVVNVKEYGRVVVVEAESIAEARSKARAGEWENCGSPAGYSITLVGPSRKVHEAA